MVYCKLSFYYEYGKHGTGNKSQNFFCMLIIVAQYLPMESQTIKLIFYTYGNKVAFMEYCARGKEKYTFYLAAGGWTESALI